MAASQLAETVGLRDHARGPEEAITVVEYGDYECPYSRAAYRYARRFEQRPGAPSLRFVFRHFPLTKKHPHAQLAAEAAEAAAAQGRFWEMHELLFRRPTALEPDDLRDRAADLALDTERFDSELASHAHADRVAADAASGRASGVDGTPVLFFDGVRRFGRGFDGFIAAIEESRRH
jgi:protein-disulfide isomerase